MVEKIARFLLIGLLVLLTPVMIYSVLDGDPRPEAISSGYHDPAFVTRIESTANPYAAVIVKGVVSLQGQDGNVSLVSVSHTGQPILGINKGLVIFSPGRPADNRPVAGVTDHIIEPVTAPPVDYGSLIPTEAAVKRLVRETTMGPYGYGVLFDASGDSLESSLLLQEPEGWRADASMALAGGPEALAASSPGRLRLSGSACVGSHCFSRQAIEALERVLSQTCPEDTLLKGYDVQGWIQCE